MAEIPARLTTALSDRYRIESEIGSGGMATVYLAHDIRHERQVAVKVLRPDLAAALGPERFLQEIRIAAQLQHPNILPLHDSGEAEGFLYYVMPYVEGDSLRDKLAKEGELPIDDAVRILRDVVDALTEAHANGVVHRDIKPENILLRGRHALVTDFGVAKAVSEATGRETLTTAGVALGTPAYMAPEQASADPHLDQRVDIYAVGAVAYELLTGRPVFMGTTPQMILSAHMAEAPQPVTNHRDTVPTALESVVMRCLEKRPADRWQSAEELLPQLEVLATPSGGVTPTRTIPVAADSRNRRVLRVGAAVVAATVVVSAAVMFGRGIGRGGAVSDGDDTASDRLAVLPFVSRSPDTADAFLAEALAEQIGIRLDRLQELRVLSAAAVAAQMRRTPDPLEAALALEADRFVTGSFRRATNDLYAHLEVVHSASGVRSWSNSFTRDDGDLAALEREVAESVAMALVGTVSPVEADELGAKTTDNREAYRLFLLANAHLNRRTEETVARAVDYYREAVRLDSTFAEAWAMLALARMVQYTWTPWEAEVPRDSLPELARTAISRALALDSLCATAWSAHGSLAGHADRDFARARTSFERALELDSLNAETFHWYGAMMGAHSYNFDLATAEQLLRRALALEPDRPNTWNNLGLTLRNQGRLVESEAVFDTLIALGPWVQAYFHRSFVRYLRGNGVGALADFAEAERLGSENSPHYPFGPALFSIAAGDSLPAQAWLELHYGRETSRADSIASIFLNIGLGRLEEALVLLEALPRDVSKWAMLHNPFFEPLHDNPRFRRILEESQPAGW